MSKLQPVRGTRDIYGLLASRHHHIINTSYNVCEKYGYERIETPIFEFTNVFLRSIGETTDIVSKEMYTFEDRKGESLTLRPEGTASVVRSLISNGRFQELPLKQFYAGPMFRYERPQKGRYRQFHQIGAEFLGADSPRDDVEVISMAYNILEKLGITKDIVLHLNTLGDTASRHAYRDALVDYFSQYKDELSEDSQTRLEKNPLRILDSKNPRDQELSANAPAFEEYLNDASKAYFDEVCKGLDNLGFEYVLNDKLVRGLDYYSHSVFEFVTEELGAQGTVLAGGRYDGLVQQMGGKPTSAIGFAAGIERLEMLMPELEDQVLPVIMMPIGEDVFGAADKMTHDLRRAGCKVLCDYTGNLKKRFNRADKIGAGFAIIVGSEELAAETVTLKNLKTGDQDIVKIAELEKKLS